jgi:uncharacterized membrane protein HdeD (DUF308 family)
MTTGPDASHASEPQVTEGAALSDRTAKSPDVSRGAAEARSASDAETKKASTPEPLPPAFRRVWLLTMFRGLLLLVLGLLLLLEPVRDDLDRLRLVIGVFLVADGVVAGLGSLWRRHQAGWPVWLAQTVVDLALGAVVIFWPDLTPKALYYVLAAWAIIIGVTIIVTAGVLARARDLEWTWSLTAGIVAFLFGLLLVLRPQDTGDIQATTALVFAFLAWACGAIYVVTGFATRAMALELRGLHELLAANGVSDPSVGGRTRPQSVLGGLTVAPDAAPSVDPDPDPGPDPGPGVGAEEPSAAGTDPVQPSDRVQPDGPGPTSDPGSGEADSGPGEADSASTRDV